MTKDARIYLEDILECIEKIREYTREMDLDEFIQNSSMQDAVLRRFEIIGEAVKHLPEDLKAQYPKVPWKEIAGMRDVLIHEYAGVHIDRVWRAIEKDIPVLRKEIKRIIRDLKK